MHSLLSVAQANAWATVGKRVRNVYLKGFLVDKTPTLEREVRRWEWPPSSSQRRTAVFSTYGTQGTGFFLRASSLIQQEAFLPSVHQGYSGRYRVERPAQLGPLSTDPQSTALS